MADQAAMSEVIAKAIEEATRVVIQAMTDAQAQIMPNTSGPKVDSPTLKQPSFNWEVTDKYTEWKAFILEVRNVLSIYNLQEMDKIAMVKNWLGRKGPHYIESLMEGEKERRGTLEGLVDTLATKFRPQDNQTIKFLQFRQLQRSGGESIDEWMGRLHMAVAESGYREIDRQLKEQFIHSLDNKGMLDKIIKELMTKNNDDQTTSEGVLVWAKRVEAQQVQAAILSDITETCQFDKVKVNQKPKDNPVRQTAGMTGQRRQCRYCGGVHMPRQCPAYGKTCVGCRKTGHFRKGCQSKRDHAVHKLEVEVAQETHEAEIETVSITSVCLNRN